MAETYTFTQVSPAGKRLLWTLNGPLESAIQVAPDIYYEPGDAMEPYFRPAADGLPASWHPVSQESLMEPRVPAVTVRLACVDAWDDMRAELHGESPYRERRRPRYKEVQLEVAASGAFLTVHEYVSAVHPWVMSMREAVLDIMAKLKGNMNAPWPPETKLAVLALGSRLRIDVEDKWAGCHKKPRPVVHVEMSKEEREARHRAVKERMLARSAARIRELERQRQENNRDGPV